MNENPKAAQGREVFMDLVQNFKALSENMRLLAGVVHESNELQRAVMQQNVQIIHQNEQVQASIGSLAQTLAMQAGIEPADGYVGHPGHPQYQDPISQLGRGFVNWGVDQLRRGRPPGT